MKSLGDDGKNNNKTIVIIARIARIAIIASKSWYQSTASPSEWVDAVNVDGVSLLLQHSPEREIVIFYKIKTILMHDHCIIT